MRHLCLANLLLLAACESEPSSSGTTGEATGTTSAGVDSTEGESSTGLEEWSGEAMLLRTVSDENERCSDVCGSSVCVAVQASNETEVEDARCDQAEYQVECTCADLSETIEASSTHGVSRCYLNPNSGSRLAVDPPLWESGTCEEYCGAFGFTCAGTVWGEMKACPNLERDDWAFYPDGPTTRPDDISGPDGVFVVLCEL